MLSTRGAITTNVALVECAAGQNKADKSVFLLSELEKVWVSVAVVVRRLLLDGNAVQILPFGAFWTEEYVLLRDRQQRPYTTRKLCFGVHQNYASRYGIDTSKVPLEKRSGAAHYARVGMADIVAVCGVPAHTAAAALKEFFMYLGEGLSRGRIYHLSLPGVATIGIKQQKLVLTMNEELRHALYEIDSRKWASELKEEGLKALEDLSAIPASGVTSAQSSRPSTSRVSRVSWRATPTQGGAPASAHPHDSSEAKKAVFIAAAPSGRTFDEIAQQEEQRRSVAQMAANTARDLRRRQEELNRRIQHYYTCDGDRSGTYYADPAGDEMRLSYEDEVTGVDDGRPRSLRAPSASGESIYNILAETDGRATAPSHRNGRLPPHHPIDEPEVEVIEMVDDEADHQEASRGAGDDDEGRRPLVRKDAELERVLREEEPFSRPISRRTYHETCAARDLIYSQPYEASERTFAAAGPSSLHRPSRNSISTAAHARGAEDASGSQPVKEQSSVSAQRGQQQQQREEVFRFGRKRFDGNEFDDDHVGSLLQYRS